MPELPEVASRAAQMKGELVGRSIAAVEVLQPKCINLPVDDFVSALRGAAILDVTHRGKWLFVQTTRGWLLLNLGMGGEVLLVTRASLPEKRRLVVDFTDGASLSINFWWFGYAHYVPADALPDHAMTARLGPNALGITLDQLRTQMSGKRKRVKAFLLDQSEIAGIGNAYVHDILFLARLHPLQLLNSLSEDEVEALWKAIRAGLQPSIDKGGAFYEVDLHGCRGGFSMEHILVGYKEGQPCPRCGAPIAKIKTGSTSSFICPRCQMLHD
jgi:formamidopyrimidine-DNA glycosylase